MSVDNATVRRVAHLARIKVGDEEAERLTGELNDILGFVEQLSAVNIDNVEPMTAAVDTTLRQRHDEITEGGTPDRVLANAPERDEGYFLVPKVVE